MKVIKLSCAEFYEELWSLTGQELRIRYALSPFALDVVCERHHLPKPPLGYWIKVHRGKKPKRRPLPSLADPPLGTIVLPLLEPDLFRCKLSHESISVPMHLNVSPHELAATAVRVYLQRASGDLSHSRTVAIEIS